MTKSNGNTAKNADVATNENLPLFFKNPVPLDAERHREAGVLTKENVEFAKNTNSVFINTIEFIEAAKYYPIVFSVSEMPSPVVLMGLENTNYFVGSDKHWQKNTYVPAYVRRYPFVFLELAEEDKLVLCIDEESEAFCKKLGKDIQPLFDDGKPSQLSINALEFCRAFQQEYVATREFCQALKEADLLSATHSDIKLKNGRELQLGGFQIIDEAKFRSLDDAQILEFHKKGWMPLIYLTLMSSTNWRTLINMASDAEA